MKSSLEYFKEKICTIFTVPFNRDFKSENPKTFPQPMFHYFVGRVVEIDAKGVWMEQWNSKKKLRSFFFFDHIVSICEEEILNPNDPEDSRIIDDYKKANEIAHKQENEQENNYIDIDSLSKLASGNQNKN